MPRFARFLALLLVVSACAAGDIAAIDAEPAPSAMPSPMAPERAGPSSTTSTTEPDYYDGFDGGALPVDVTLVAMAKGDLAVYESPGSSETALTLPAETILGTPTVATIIEGPVDGWARVMLPVRPNGTTGWIKLTDATTYVVEGRIVIDLSERELILYRGGEEVIRTETAVGSDRNPTPTGHFYVTDSVRLSDPTSPWGPYAFGLSGRSETITEYNGGDGIIGIHGTNRPGSIGQAASLGCIRLPNEVITTLHQLVAIGTPVEIRA